MAVLSTLVSSKPTLESDTKALIYIQEKLKSSSKTANINYSDIKMDCYLQRNKVTLTVEEQT